MMPAAAGADVEGRRSQDEELRDTTGVTMRDDETPKPQGAGELDDQELDGLASGYDATVIKGPGRRLPI